MPDGRPLSPPQKLRDGLVQAVNGNPISADEAWALLHAWDALNVVADDALALLDQHIAEGQRRELGIRIIDRLTEVGKLT